MNAGTVRRGLFLLLSFWPVAVGAAQSVAERRFAAAREDVVARRFLQAETQLRTVLMLIGPSDTSVQRKAQSLLETVTRILAEQAQLDEADRLLGDRNYQGASSILKELVPKLTDGRLLERAGTLWEKSHPGRWRPVLAKLESWGLDLSPYLVALLPVAIGLSLWRRLLRKNRWTLKLSDSTNQGVDELIASHLCYWTRHDRAPVTAGLLLLDAAHLPLAPDFSLRDQDLDLAKALDSVVLTVGPVNVGAVARSVALLDQLLNPRRQTIHGIAFITEKEPKQLIARLTARYFEKEKGPRADVLPRPGTEKTVERVVAAVTSWGVLLRPRPSRVVERIVTVTAMADASSPDAATAVADEVAFKMLYTIAAKADDKEADRAADLSHGLEQLRFFVSGSPEMDGWQRWENLDKARQIFARVRNAYGDFLEAHLYEGIALDLLERHDEAIEHFRYIKEMAKHTDHEMYRRAAYNEAVAQLRDLYQYEGVEECIILVSRMTEAMDPKALGEVPPITILAWALQADAIACRLIHWKVVSDAPAGSGVAIARTDEEKLKAVVDQCIAGVEEITGEIRQFLGNRSQQAKWTADALRQLDWAINNAEGDLYLYSVVAIDYEIGTRALGGSKRYQPLCEIENLVARTDTATQERRRRYLQNALSVSNRCEMLMPAGVETLSNLGTVFLFRGQADDLPLARHYFEMAIRLNPYYEYAYYRLAQCWEREGPNRREDVKKTLERLQRPPRIHEFLKMYTFYEVQPKVVDDPFAFISKPAQTAGAPPNQRDPGSTASPPPRGASEALSCAHGP